MRSVKNWIESELPTYMVATYASKMRPDFGGRLELV